MTTARIAQRPHPPQRREVWWIDVRDHLPDDEITVLITYGDEEVSLGWHEEGTWKECGGGCYVDVTHWAHLPVPPPLGGRA